MGNNMPGRPDADRDEGGKYTEVITRSDVVAVFEGRSDPYEPLSASEVADALGCNRKTAYSKLQSLADEGVLATKKIGARGRAYWLPEATIQRDPEPAPGEAWIAPDDPFFTADPVAGEALADDETLDDVLYGPIAGDGDE